MISYRIVKGDEEDHDNRDYDESHAPLCRHVERYSVTPDDGDVVRSDRNEGECKKGEPARPDAVLQCGKRYVTRAPSAKKSVGQASMMRLGLNMDFQGK